MKMKTLTAALLALAFAGCGDSNPRPRQPVAPSIEAIPAQSISANETGSPINVRAQGESTLSYAVTSDTPSVVADADLSLVSNAAGGVLTITPVADVLGDAMLTIVVTDQSGLSDSTAFLVTVEPQRLSLQAFAREQFAAPEPLTPTLINAVVFDQDADNDDFADLLAP